MRRDMRWLLLLTAIIGIVGCANALKATALIFGRVPNANKTTATTTTTTTTTTTSTTVAPADTDPSNDGDEKKDDDGSLDDETATKPPLTGIPQIDYIWDPNLPRELNGYNLSTYPFLNSVPDNEDIDFKCDGLHDGFYASIKYSCQLYHHCVYGIRHDFLCANFTAFDQKSFICHFVSEVNCKASPKYWFRNDALYKATTTTSTTTTTIAPPPTTSLAPERPLRRPESRRPLRRRRPQHEYYYDDEDYDDEYVEERMNRRRKTNRNRNRRPPEYDDDYDSLPPRASYKDDEDDYSFEQRASHRHRNRNRDAEPDDFEFNDRRSYRPNRKRPSDKRYYQEDDRPTAVAGDLADERRPHSDGRKSVDPPPKRKHNDRLGYGNDEKNAYDDRRQPTSAVGAAVGEEDRRVRVTEKRRPNSERRPAQYDYDYDYPGKKIREDDYDDGKVYGKRPTAHNKHSQPEIIPKVRSSSSTASIYNRPRSPPKINRPVPNNEKKKYDYSPSKAAKATTTTAPAAEDDFYDDYDYESEKQQSDIKPEPVDSKKISFSSGPSSQREHRPPPPPPSRVELKLEKLPPTPAYADEFEDDDFDGRDRVTSAKPQRSTSPKAEHMQQHQQRNKPDYYDKQKDSPAKPNVRPTLDFNKDEYIPDDVAAEYPDEEIDDRITKEEDIQQPEMERSRNDFRENAPAQQHRHQPQQQQPKVPEVMSMPKVVKEPESISYAQPQSQHQSQLDVYKTKFHRLAPSQSMSTSNANSRHTDNQRAPNTEPEERDVYTILPKDTISAVREPSGFKPVGYEPSAHDTDFGTPKHSRPYVRIMKRPFLPSRGGSPYLPRGLKPVGAGITTPEYTTTEGYHNAAAKMPLSNIANGQYYTQNLPNARINPNTAYGQQEQQQQHPRGQLPLQLPSPQPNVGSITSNDVRTSTQQPQIESPRSPLDEIFNSDYDVTLNDALNPTLKPLSHHESPISHGFTLNKYDHSNNPYSRSDVSQSPSQYRTTAIPNPSSQSRHAPQPHHQARHQPSPMQQQSQKQQQQPPQQSQSQYYDDEYDY